MIDPLEVTTAAGVVTTQLGSLITDLFALAPIIVPIAGFLVLWGFASRKLSLKR